eukprot:19778_1
MTLISHDFNESICFLARFTVGRWCCWVEEVVVIGFTCSDFPAPKEEVSSIPLPPRLLATAAALIFFSCLRKAAISSTIDCSSIGANRGSSAQNSTECAQPVTKPKATEYATLNQTIRATGVGCIYMSGGESSW